MLAPDVAVLLSSTGTRYLLHPLHEVCSSNMLLTSPLRVFLHALCSGLLYSTVCHCCVSQDGVVFLPAMYAYAMTIRRAQGSCTACFSYTRAPERFVPLHCHE